MEIRIHFIGTAQIGKRKVFCERRSKCMVNNNKCQSTCLVGVSGEDDDDEKQNIITS